MKFLKSLRLAVVLIGYLVAFSILATVIPQGKGVSYYVERYPQAVARVVLALRLNRAFTSPLFLIPGALFLMNLATCAAHRFVTRLRAGVPKRFGPDVIHLGLLILAAGGFLTLRGRGEDLFFLKAGDRVGLPSGRELILESSREERYEDGRPKGWYSRVAVTEHGAVITEHTIQVNRPLSVGGLRVYQDSYRREAFATLRDGGGRTYTLLQGESFEAGDSVLLFRGFEGGGGSGGAALFEKWRGGARLDVLRRAKGEKVEGYLLVETAIRDLTGLRVVRDPGAALVIPALILVGFGTALAFYQKLGDRGL